MSHGTAAPATEAHFLVQSTCDVGERWLPTPDQWYRFQDLVSDGERRCVAEWDLDVVYDTQASEEVVGSTASDWSGIVFGEALSVRVLHLWLSGVRAATMQLSMKVVFFCEATTLDTGQAGLWLCCRFECHDSIWMRSVSHCARMSVAFYGGTPRAIEGLYKCQEQLRDVGTAVLRRDGFGEHLAPPFGNVQMCRRKPSIAVYPCADLCVTVSSVRHEVFKAALQLSRQPVEFYGYPIDESELHVQLEAADTASMSSDVAIAADCTEVFCGLVSLRPDLQFAWGGSIVK